LSPRFSVVMANFNNGPYIRQAIESVRAQTWRDYELIVVDDGSTDNSRDIIAELAPAFGERLRCLYQDNQGPARAQNAGIAVAEGQFLTFLDSDDVWQANRLSRHADVLDRHPSVGFCCSDFFIVYGDETTDRRFLKWVPRKGFPYDAVISSTQAFRLLLGVNFVGTGAATVRRTDVQALGGFDSRYRQAEDYDLWLRVAMHTDVYVIPEVLHSYRCDGNGLTGNRRENLEFSRWVLENLSSNHKRYIAANGLAATIRSRIAQFWRDYGDALFENGKRIEAFRAYHNGFVANPVPSNAARCLAVCSRKAIRSLSFGILSRQNMLAAARAVSAGHTARH